MSPSAALVRRSGSIARRSARSRGAVKIRQLSTAWWHAGANVLVVLIELYNLFSRYQQGPSAIIPNGLVVSLIAVLLLLFSGWKGGDLVFRGHVGVADN